MRANGPERTVREVLAKFQDFAVLGYAGAGEVVDMGSSVRDLDIGSLVAYGGEGHWTRRSHRYDATACGACA